MIQKNNKIFVAGHRGLVGSALVRILEKKGYKNLLLKTSKEVDLRDQTAVHQFFKTEKPDIVILAAAKVGGIYANNTYRGDFIYDNLMMEANVVHAAKIHAVQRLLFLGSSCIYPRDCVQPMKEEYLLTGPLEKTNESYALAKIAGIKLCEAFNDQYGTKFFSVMPTNLYGPNDNFDLQNSHVLPALIRKVHEAKMAKTSEVVVWGTGKPKREFLHVDDMAAACLFLLENYDGNDVINVGSGEEIAIHDLAKLICEIVGFQGKLTLDSSKPDGTPRKLLDISRLKKLGFTPKIDLKTGITDTYRWFIEHYSK